jgi:pyruvate/2-oxoacid:ferredoxin oxidoreductase beta subunit
MNKGKPSGFKADTKQDAGAKSTSHERTGTAGAGPEWSEKKQREQEVVHAGGDGGPAQQAGGPDHRGGDAHEDRNP